MYMAAAMVDKLNPKSKSVNDIEGFFFSWAEWHQ
jgi:hypothetical protein